MNAERLACGNCRAPMQRLGLAAHYGRTVEVDLCAPCHLVWFDGFESVNLTGAGALSLLQAMAAAQRTAHHPLGDASPCPRCRQTLRAVHNRSRWGRSQHLECPRRDGTLHTFAQWLAEKGWMRPLSPADRAALQARPEGLACLNCGAPVEPGASHCRWCGTLPGVLDIGRLARALDPDGATESHPVHRARPEHRALACAACGAAAPDGSALRCAACGATLAAPSVDEALAQVAALGPALRAHDQRPAPHVLARRLDRLRGDIDRQRGWARDMARDAGGGGDSGGSVDEDADWLADWRERPGQVVAAVVLLLFVYWLLWA